MALIKGIVSFPHLFTPKIPKGATEAKYSCVILLPPNDPQIAALNAEVEAAKANTFPSGVPAKANICFTTYDERFTGTEYYDPRFTGWYAFSCTAKADDKPAVVDTAHQPIIDPGSVCSGMNVWVNANISGYVKGTGGIGGWLNGVMTDLTLGDMGRLDNKPTVEQMFANVGAPAAAAPAAAPAAPVAPVAPAAPVAPVAPVAPAAPVAPVAPVAPAAPAAAPAALVMTAAANGVTYEQYMATPGWTDELLIQQGLAIRPSFA